MTKKPSQPSSKPSPTSQPSPSQEGEQAQDTAATEDAGKAGQPFATPDNDNAEAMEQSVTANNDNSDNMEKTEAKHKDKKGGGLDDTIKNAESHGVPIADLMGDEGALQFAKESPEEAGEDWKQQAEEWKDKAHRAMAEEANTRNRLQRERAELLKFAAAPLANEIFQIADILSNAIKSLPDTWQDNKELKNFIDGLRMTEQSLKVALEKHHIRQIGKAGDKFDAAYHQAVSVIEDNTAQANHIVEVLQPGYMLHDRILRPAQVVIAKPSVPSSTSPNSS